MNRVFEKVETSPWELYKAWSRVSVEYSPFSLLFAFSLHIFPLCRFVRVLSQGLMNNMASNADAHRVPFLSHIASLKELFNAPGLTVISRDATGKPVAKYPTGQPSHLYVANNLCRAMLKQSKVREGLITFAVRFGSSRPNAWYRQVRPPKTTTEVVDSYIDMIMTEPLTEFMDYALKNPDNKGFHSRRRWDKSFKPALQPISLNARVCEICRVNCDKSCSSKLTVT